MNSSKKTREIAWDDVLDFDVDALLELNALTTSNKDDETAKSLHFPNESPIDRLAKSLIAVRIAPEKGTSDRENVILMQHLAKVLQCAYERAIVKLEYERTMNSSLTTVYDCFGEKLDVARVNEVIEEVERERDLLRIELRDKERAFKDIVVEMRACEIEFMNHIEKLGADDDAGDLPKTPKPFLSNEDDDDFCFRGREQEQRERERRKNNDREDDNTALVMRANARATALETQTNALSDALEDSRRENRRLETMLDKEKARNEELERRKNGLNERLMSLEDSKNNNNNNNSIISKVKRTQSSRLGKSKMPPQTVEKTKKILSYNEDDHYNNNKNYYNDDDEEEYHERMTLTREETLNRWDARAQFKIAMDQLRRDLSIKSAQYDAVAAKCDAQSRVISKTVKERDDLKDETKRLQRLNEKAKSLELETIENIRRDAEEKEERDKTLMREAVSSLRQKVRSLERERDSLRDETTQNADQLDKMKQKATKAMEKNTRLQKEVTEMNFKIDKLQDEKTRMVDLYEHETLKIELDRAEERYRKLKVIYESERKQSEDESKRLEDELETYEKRCADLEKSKLDFESLSSVRERDIETIKKQNLSLSAQLQDIISEWKMKEDGFLNTEKKMQLETIEIAETLLKYERENKALKEELSALDPKFFEEVFVVKEKMQKRGLILSRYEAKLKSYSELLNVAFRPEIW